MALAMPWPCSGPSCRVRRTSRSSVPCSNSTAWAGLPRPMMVVNLPSLTFYHRGWLTAGADILPAVIIPDSLAAFLEEGIGIYLATRNAALEPNGARAIAARVEQDGGRLVIYVADAGVARLLPDLEANGMAAVTFGRPVDERACQVKGTFVES